MWLLFCSLIFFFNECGSGGCLCWGRSGLRWYHFFFFLMMLKDYMCSVVALDVWWCDGGECALVWHWLLLVVESGNAWFYCYWVNICVRFMFGPSFRKYCFSKSFFYEWESWLELWCVYSGSDGCLFWARVWDKTLFFYAKAVYCCSRCLLYRLCNGGGCVLSWHELLLLVEMFGLWMLSKFCVFYVWTEFEKIPIYSLLCEWIHVKAVHVVLFHLLPRRL